MDFVILDDHILENMLAYIADQRAKGLTPTIRVRKAANNRSLAQNKLFRKWIGDIERQSSQSLTYESGRCKMKYFLPLMKLSQNEEAVYHRDYYAHLYRTKGYEYLLNMLGNGWMPSTSLLTVNEFTEALNNMRMTEESENGYILTDPDNYGWRDWMQAYRKM